MAGDLTAADHKRILERLLVEYNEVIRKRGELGRLNVLGAMKQTQDSTVAKIQDMKRRNQF